MKRYIFVLFLIGTLLSCNVLDERFESVVSAQTYYTTDKQLSDACNPIYNHICDLCDRTCRFNTICMGANDVTTNVVNKDYMEFETFNPSSSNVMLSYYWGNYFKVIIACNNVIVNSTKVPDSAVKKYRSWTGLFWPCMGLFLARQNA